MLMQNTPFCDFQHSCLVFPECEIMKGHIPFMRRLRACAHLNKAKRHWAAAVVKHLFHAEHNCQEGWYSKKFNDRLFYMYYDNKLG